jgi:acetyl-CoA carboxylase carboxyl transferase alpha subunit
MEMAEHFEIPVYTVVDTVGAYPSFDSEKVGQSEALATNLLRMASLKVPLITVVIGEGGSGGALGIAMGNRIAMLERAYYAVISPEGAASILGRYKDEAHKAVQFPNDCRSLASQQKIYAHNLLELGVIDKIITEEDGENVNNCERLMGEIKTFFVKSYAKLSKLSVEEILEHRYKKFRRMGKFQEISDEEVQRAKSAVKITPRSTHRKPQGVRSHRF